MTFFHCPKCVSHFYLWSHQNGLYQQFSYQHSVQDLLSEVTQLCLTLCNPMDCRLPGFSVHGNFQARELEWGAISFSRGSSRPRVWTWVSHNVGRRFTLWATRETPRSLRYSLRRLSFSKGFSFLSELSWGSLLTVHSNVDWFFFFSINLRTPPASMHYPVPRLLPHFLGICFNSSPLPGPISVLVHLGCYNINTIDWVTYEQKNFFLTLLEV